MSWFAQRMQDIEHAWSIVLKGKPQHFHFTVSPSMPRRDRKVEDSAEGSPDTSHVFEAAADGTEATQATVAEGSWPPHATVARYIPFMGGSLGWFENSGVTNVEKPSNYRYFTAVDTDRIRAALLERSKATANKRKEPRKRLHPETKVTLLLGKRTFDATCKDFSASGMRLLLADEHEVFRKDEQVTVRVHDKSGRKLLLELLGPIVWANKFGKTRTVWDFGIRFSELSEQQASMVKELTVELGMDEPA